MFCSQLYLCYPVSAKNAVRIYDCKYYNILYKLSPFYKILPKVTKILFKAVYCTHHEHKVIMITRFINFIRIIMNEVCLNTIYS